VEGEIAEQMFPQVPQLLLSVCALTQVLLHANSFRGQFNAAQVGDVSLQVPSGWQARLVLPNSLKAPEHE
jgi:hypothetical protein